MDNQEPSPGLAADERDEARRYSYLICLVIFLSYLLVYFHRVCPSVIALDMQNAFGVGGALLGVLGSAYFYPYALMQLPVGLLADSWGPRRTVAVLLAVAAAGSMIMGLTSQLSWAIVGRVLVGLGVAPIFVCNFKLLTEWFPARQMVVVGGVFMAVGGVGVLGASAPLAYLSELIGWDGSLAAVGGVTFVMAGLVYLIVRDRPSEKGWPDVRTEPSPYAPGLRGLLASAKEVVSAARFWVLGGWSFFCVGLTFALGSMWSVPFLQHVYHLTKTEASGYQTTFGLALIFGSPAVSFLANHVGRKWTLWGCSLLLAFVCGLFFARPDGWPPAALYVMFLGLFLAGGTPGPVLATFAKELFHPSMAGVSVGLVNCFPFLGGGLLQVIMGAILDRGGQVGQAYTLEAYRWVFGLCFIGALISVGASLLMTETLPLGRRGRK